MSEEEQKYFKGLIGFTFDSDDIKYIEKIVDKKDKEIERLENIIKEVREYITSQELHKIQDTTGALTYREIKLLEILDKENI